MPLFRKGDTNVLFVHIPKSGGTSITRAFRQSGYSVEYFDGRTGKGTLNHLHHCTPQHWHAELLSQILRLDRMDVIFSFVRHPETRLQSEYLWRHRRRSSVNTGADAVEAWATKAFDRWRSGEKYLFDNHIRPQSEFLLPNTVQLKVEDGIDTQLAQLSETYDLGLTAPLQRVKQSDLLPGGRRSHEVEVSPRLAKTVRRFYRRDFRALDYR